MALVWKRVRNKVKDNGIIMASHLQFFVSASVNYCNRWGETSSTTSNRRGFYWEDEKSNKK